MTIKWPKNIKDDTVYVSYVCCQSSMHKNNTPTRLPIHTNVRTQSHTHAHTNTYAHTCTHASHVCTQTWTQTDRQTDTTAQKWYTKHGVYCIAVMMYVYHTIQDIISGLLMMG